MLREFDARAGWNTGFLSCAQWLHWRTGFDLGACREKVRVARALAVLPLVSAEMQRGRLSYAKVRAITRVATPGSEQALLDLALAGTSAQVERCVRAWRSVDRVEAARQADTRHLSRELSTWVDDDGMVVIRARLTPEAGAVVQRALQAASDRLFREASGAEQVQALTDEVTPRQRRAEALVRLAEAALAGDLEASAAGDRYQVVVHIDHTADGGRAVADEHDGREAPLEAAVIEAERQMVDVSAETSRRMACDASLVTVWHAGDGSSLDVSRKTRAVPAATRRALVARDSGCRFPGCNSRYCDAHHVRHWADGGPTRLDNLVLLCRRHHRLVHEGGFTVSWDVQGTVAFQRADGTVLPLVPPPLDPDRVELPQDVDEIPIWDGIPLDLAWAIDVLRPQLATCGPVW